MQRHRKGSSSFFGSVVDVSQPRNRWTDEQEGIWNRKWAAWSWCRTKSSVDTSVVLR